MTPTFSWLLSEKCARHCCDADRKWDCRGILEQIHARKKKSECRKKAEYLKCCTQTFRCNKLKSIKWKTLNQVKVLSPYFLFFFEHIRFKRGIFTNKLYWQQAANMTSRSARPCGPFARSGYRSKSRWKQRDGVTASRRLQLIKFPRWGR